MRLVAEQQAHLETKATRLPDSSLFFSGSIHSGVEEAIIGLFHLFTVFVNFGLLCFLFTSQTLRPTFSNATQKNV